MSDPLTDLLRKGARELLQTAVAAELDAFLTEFAKHRTPEGRAAVVRNGHHPERAVQTGIGPVTVQIPKVRSKTGAPVTFRSALVPPYIRKAKLIEAALPLLYLKGISTGEMGAALKALLGLDATGFSAKTVARLKTQWGPSTTPGARPILAEMNGSMSGPMGSTAACAAQMTGSAP
ncbi:Transposase, Mutator family [Marinovum algicola]|uniref:Mutator family transposase n=1 Tax=Marinovum algicola TaxID=42444 RepID=A0A975ZR40_9RHOB|nr:Transposase, Mutator family [Marinovum algicola]SLN71093.1 Transposase, Mutator family [Marinovum algicola]